MNNPGEVFRILDHNSGEMTGFAVAGPPSEQTVHMNGCAFGLKDFLSACEHVLLSGDLAGKDCPRRKFIRNISELEEVEGRSFGAKRLRPSREQLTANNGSH